MSTINFTIRPPAERPRASQALPRMRVTASNSWTVFSAGVIAAAVFAAVWYVY